MSAWLAAALAWMAGWLAGCAVTAWATHRMRFWIESPPPHYLPHFQTGMSVRSSDMTALVDALRSEPDNNVPPPPEPPPTVPWSEFVKSG